MNETTRRTRNPYPGLRPFGADEEKLFFGRRAEVDAIRPSMPFRIGSITKRGSAIARFLLGQVVVHVVRCDARIREWYRKIKKRRGAKIARVAVMRRVTTIIWRMLKSGESYELAASPKP